MEINPHVVSYLKDNMHLIRENKYAELLDGANTLILGEVMDVLKDAGINVLDYLQPDEWWVASWVEDEKVLTDNKFEPYIFEKINNKHDPSLITIPINFQDIAMVLAENSDFSRDCMLDFLMGDYDAQWESSWDLSHQEVIDAFEYYFNGLPKDLQDKFKDNGYVVNGKVQQDKMEQDPQLIEVLGKALMKAKDAGSIDDMGNDFQDAFDNSLPKWVYNFNWDHRTVDIAHVDIPEFGMELIEGLELRDDCRDEIPYVIRDILYNYIGDHFKFHEPQYGWHGFDDNIYADEIRDNLT